MRKRENENHLPDFTSLIDVLFILLIFFLFSSTFRKREKTITLNLPKISSQESLKKDQLKTQIISVKKDRFFLNGKALSYKALRTHLGKVPKDLEIHIRSDGSSPFNSVMEVLDILKKYGFQFVHLRGQSSP